ncbi:hypothetical protein RUND412_010457 [Rhizina undulata]
MLNFASIFQLPMVGSDVCGYGGNTTEQMYARWAMLEAFNPFYRDHNDDTSIPQDLVNRISASLPDVLQVPPGWQHENATSVDVYLPNDIYDFETLKPVYGQGRNLMIEDVGLTDIPVFIKGGSIIPLRFESAMTTTELWTQPFVIVVAPGVVGEASGELYLDDGESLVQESSSVVKVVVAGEKRKEVTVEWDLEGQWDIIV